MKSVNIDVQKSLIHWKAFKPHGGHNGTLNFKSGTVTLSDDNIPVGGSFEFDMNTIQDDDLSEGMMKNKLIEDLKGTEFFDVAKFPEALFTIDKVDHTPDDGGYYGVSGDLSMRGIKNEVSFKAKFKIEGSQLTVESNVIVIDRTKWGINHGSKNIFKKLTENIIADNFDIMVTVVAPIG